MSALGDVAVPFALDVLARGESLWVREASLSMGPLIRPGDELLLVPPRAGEIRGGSVIAYEQGARLVIHRVLAASGSGVVAKGDALGSLDPLVSWDRVIARVVALRGPDGRVVNLDAFPWPPLNRLLGGIASLASRISGEAPQPLLRRLVWKAFRLPFYLARLVLG